MKKIGILSTTPPIASSAPGSPRLFSIVQEWAKENHLALLLCDALALGSGRNEGLETCRDFFKSIEALPPAPASSTWGKLKHRLHNAPFYSLEYRSPDYFKQIQARVLSFWQTHELDYLFVYLLSPAQFLPEPIPGARVWIDLVDDPTLLYRRQQEQEDLYLRRIDLWLEAASLGKQLQRLQQRKYRMSVVSPEDAAHLKQQWGIPAVVNPLGIDCTYFNQTSAQREPKTLVFTGVMNYGPNADAAQYFVSEILPLVRQSHPDTRVLLVGADPAPQVQALATEQGVTVTGTVDDVRLYLNKATLFICPMRIGAGVKNKILAAMAMQIPVLSTSSGISGIEARAGEHFLLANSPQEFAQNIDAVFSGEINTSQLIANALDLVRHRYAADTHARALLRAMCSQE